MNEKITVLVADDNSDFTMTLSSYLEKEEQIQIVGIAKDGNEAYEKANADNYPDFKDTLPKTK